MKQPKKRLIFGMAGLAMVVLTITLVGLVAFRLLRAQDNTTIATSDTVAPATNTIAPINEAHDVDTVINQIDSIDLDAMNDANLDAELNF